MTKKLNQSGSINKKDLLSYLNDARFIGYSAKDALNELELFCRANSIEVEGTNPLRCLAEAEK